MICPKIIFIVMVLALFSHQAKSQTAAQAIGAVIAPPELIADYTCVTFAESRLRSRVKNYAETQLRTSIDKAKALKDVIKTYASLLNAMCTDVQLQFQDKRHVVLSFYAEQLPDNKSDISVFLENDTAKLWASQNVAFLRRTAQLIELYQFASEVAPELLDQPQPTIDSDTLLEVNTTSVGAAAQDERRRLILLLKDKSFARYAPAGVDLKSTATEEERLRKESSRLMYATGFGWFNNNASDLVRRKVLFFETMRQIGLTPIFARHEVIFQRLGLEK
jgi:hypothetical protein